MPALLSLVLLLQAPEIPRLSIESYTLPNGLRVVLQPDSTVPRVAVVVAYHVGSKDERAGRTGFAHFFEHMMFRGTAQVPNYDIPLQEAGGSANAFTSEDMTVYHEVVVPEYLERAIYLEANRLAFLATALDKEKFDTEREVVKNERRQGVDNVPYGRAEEAILASLFPAGHPYSWSVIGSMEDLDRATLEDLRSFFATHYHPGNAAVALSGGFDVVEAKRLISRYFGPIPAGPAKVLPDPPAVENTDERVEMTDGVTLPRVHWIWPTVADEHGDAPALSLLSDVLTGGQASRLRRTLVRERKVAASVGAVSDTREIGGMFQIVAMPVEGTSVEELEAALGEELAKLATDPPTEAELRRVLAGEEKGTYERLAEPLARAQSLAIGAAQYGDPERYRRELERSLAVTTADLTRVAATYLKPKKLVLVIEPGEEKSSAPKAGPDPGAPATREFATRELVGDQPDWSRLPGPAATESYRTPPVVRRTLSNGLEVWFVRWPTLPIVEARLLLPAGSSRDPEGKSGLAALMASVAPLGTETRTATELAEAIETLGGSMAVNSGLDEAAVLVNVLSSKIEPVLGLVAEALRQPRLDPEDFARERNLQVIDLKRAGDDPARIATRVYPGLLYGRSHPYGRPGDGRIETVEGLTREDLVAFHKSHYVPQGAKLVIAGDLDPKTLFPMLERTLGEWRSEPTERTALEPTPAKDAGEPAVVYLVDKPSAAQSVIRVGRLWVGRDDPRYFAVELGNRVLGGDFLSRLNQNLRERNGYTYGAGSRVSYPVHEGRWDVFTSVRTDATGPALREIVNELSAVAKGGDRAPTDEEIADNRDAEARSWLDAFGSPGGVVELISEFAKYDLPEAAVATYLDQLRGATDDVIRSALAELADPSRQVILVVGDRAEVEPQLKAAGFSTILPLTKDGQATE